MIPTWLRDTIEALLNPVVRRLISGGINPNVLTTVGTLISLGAALGFAVGSIRLGGALLLFSGLFDMLDGRVARGGGRSTAFGAFYDSTLDRVADTGLFLGIAIYFLTGGLNSQLVNVGVVAAVLALAFSLTVSYARARAEGLGLDCKVGVVQRAERLLGLGVPSLFFGAGPEGLLLFSIVAVLAVLSAVTVIQRIVHVHSVTSSGIRRVEMESRSRAELVESLGKGRSGE